MIVKPAWVRPLAWIATALALGVIVFGAFVRLSNAGLSCPDWPTCYGRITWPVHHAAIAAADAAFPQRSVAVHLAWREQVHRFIAGTLGVLVLLLALGAVWRQRGPRYAVIVAALAATAGVWLYMGGEHVYSSALAGIAIALPLLAAWWLCRAAPWKVLSVTLGLIIFQAMLGMWTVTLLLKPAIVTSHLLGGLATFALLAYAALRLSGVGTRAARARRLLPWVVLGLVLLVMQIALGGWTSTNYAALACGTDFPLCAGSWWPALNFHQGFILWRDIGANYEGGVLDESARAAIQMTHRIGALIVFVYGLLLAWRAARAGLRPQGIVLALLLCAQVLLGIGNVMLGLPLDVATAHNAGAALLLFTMVWLLAATQRPPAQRVF
ncbi:MAG: COX15/CtaA family protein [Metallibacterium sp.]